MSQVDPTVLQTIYGNGSGRRITQTLVTLEHFCKQDPAQGAQILRVYVDGAWSHRGPSEKELTVLYELALRYDRKNADLHYCWGWDLTMLGARTEVIEERNRLMREANERYAKAVKHDPKMDAAWNNWGNNLVVLARTALETEKKALLEKAFSHYEQALRINPRKQETHFNWGKTLFQLGELAEGEERRNLLAKSVGRLDECLRIKPDRLEALYHRSQACLLLALESPTAEGDTLLKEALESIGKAAQFAPGDGLIRYHWGKCLLAAADWSDEPMAYLTYALEELRLASELRPADPAILEDYCAADDHLRLLTAAATAPATAPEIR